MHMTESKTMQPSDLNNPYKPFTVKLANASKIHDGHLWFFFWKKNFGHWKLQLAVLGLRHAGGAGWIAQHGMSLRLATWTRVMSWWADGLMGCWYHLLQAAMNIWVGGRVSFMFTRFLLPSRSTWWMRHLGFAQQMLHLERNKILHCLRIFGKQFNLQDPHYIIFHPGINTT